MARNLTRTRTNRPSSHYDGTSLKFHQILIKFLAILSISIIRIVQFYYFCIFFTFTCQIIFIIHRMSSTNLWDYYRKDTINKTSYCLICEKSRCQQCKKQKNPCMLSGLFPTNAKKHLKHHHEDVFNLVTNKEKPKKRPYEAEEENVAVTSTKNVKNFFKPRELSKEKIEEQIIFHNHFL